MRKTAIEFFSRNFGRASMLAKFSILCVIGLAYTVANLYSVENKLREDILNCQIQRLQEVQRMQEMVKRMEKVTGIQFFTQPKPRFIHSNEVSSSNDCCQ